MQFVFKCVESTIIIIIISISIMIHNFYIIHHPNVLQIRLLILE